MIGYQQHEQSRVHVMLTIGQCERKVFVSRDSVRHLRQL